MTADRSLGEGVSAEIDITGLPSAVGSAVRAAEDHKGTNLTVLDLSEVSSFTDYLLLCDGRSERHVQAIADAVVERLRESGVKPLHTEGYDQATWILIDVVDFVVNVFTPETRDFYQLDRLWRDAPVVAGERQDPAGEDTGAGHRG